MSMMRAWLMGLVVAGATVLGACGGGNENQPAAGGGGTSGAGAGGSTGGNIAVYLLPKTKGNPYFETCAQGAQEAAKELGTVTLTYDGPTSGSAEEAAKMVEQWTLKGANVIAVSASNPATLAPAMEQAQDKGVKVITWDADTPANSRSLFVCQASAEQIGTALCDTLAKDIGGGDATKAEGDVAIVTAQMTAANQNEWIKYIKARLANYPKLKLVDTQPSDDDPSKAQQVTQALIKSNPNLKGIFAISSQAFPAAAEAIKQAGKGGQIQITGLATPNGMKNYVKDGTVKSVVLWNTKDLGYLTVYAAQAVANGTYKKGDTSLKAGRLGERKIEGDVLLLGDILVFTKDNIDQYDF
jgi:ABC-type sugar transport system substrate-binding protein